jgi:hypothetical protein
VTLIADSAPVGGQSAALEISNVGISTLIPGENGFSFQLITADLEVDANGLLTARGLSEYTRNPGEPPLPIFTTFVALPPGKNAIVDVKGSRLTVHNSIEIEPLRPSLALPESRYFPHKEQLDCNHILDAIRSSNVDLQNRIYPGHTHELSKPMYVRGLRLARLIRYPVQYNPVSKQVELFEVLDINIQFQATTNSNHEIDFDLHSTEIELISNLVVNKEQVDQWEYPVRDHFTAENPWFSGEDTYKIEINEDGIYQVSYEQLAPAEMDFANIDPGSIEMMYRGDPVAYQFLGDNNNQFEPGEKIRFHGWKYQDPRLDRQFVTNNVFWLKAGGIPSLIPKASSISGDPVHRLPTSITKEPENAWFPDYSDDWESFPNEPDAWFWELIATSSEPLARTFPVELSNPASVGPPAQYTIELSSRGLFNGPPVTHTAVISLNEYEIEASQTWLNEQNLNISGVAPLTQLRNGSSDFTIVTHELPTGLGNLYSNSSVPSNIDVSGNEVIFDLQFGNNSQNKGIPRNETVYLSITATVEPSVSMGRLSLTSKVECSGLESLLGDETDQIEIYVVKESSYIPIVVR